MSKTLVISDIHQRHKKVRKLLSETEFDHCIMLGDYFDDFNDFPEDARQTALWLRDEIMPNDKITLLIGNHDIAYFFAYNQATRCSGYSDAKHKAIFSVLSYDDIIARFKWFHVQDGFLFSHAGITNKVWQEMKMREDENANLIDVLPKWIDRSFDGVRTLTAMPLFEAGWTRGGPQQHGGILWADWQEFGPIKGINQIVGHTPHNVPEVKVQLGDGVVKYLNAYDWSWSRDQLLAKTITSLNFALDTHTKHYAIIEDGIVTLWDWDMKLTMDKSHQIGTPNGLPFSPATQLGQPDYGVFQVANPVNGYLEELTGADMCRFNKFDISTSNVTMVLASLLGRGCTVKFLRHRKEPKKSASKTLQ